MTHFGLLVCCNEPSDEAFDKLLEPYSENNKRYFETVELKAPPKWAVADDGTVNEAALIESGYIQADGKWYAKYNPKGFYDYYSLDARDDMLCEPERMPDLPDESNGFYRLRDYDLTIGMTEKEEAKAREDWKRFSTEGDGWYSEDYYLSRYGNEENYIECRKVLDHAPWCFVSPDGVWHSAGEVGWFATDNADCDSIRKYCEEWKAFIASDANPYVSFVDCHI